MTNDLLQKHLTQYFLKGRIYFTFHILNIKGILCVEITEEGGGGKKCIIC